MNSTLSKFKIGKVCKLCQERKPVDQYPTNGSAEGRPLYKHTCIACMAVDMAHDPLFVRLNRLMKPAQEIVQ